MTCKDCIHNKVCYRSEWFKKDYAEKCGDFKAEQESCKHPDKCHECDKILTCDYYKKKRGRVMTKDEILKILKKIYTELNMSKDEYAEYINKGRKSDDDYKLEQDRAYAYMRGAVIAQIGELTKEIERYGVE